MLEARKILVATIGYIIGIIMGLYCKISIVLFYLLIYFITKLYTKKKNKFKLLSFRRYFRYIKVIFNKNVIGIIIVFSIISNTIVLLENYKYDSLYNKLDEKEVNVSGVIVLKTNNKYKIKIAAIDNNTKYKNTCLYINTKMKLENGDGVLLKGKFTLPSKRRNYKGFDYKEYLKTLKIYGTVKTNTIEVISKNNFSDMGHFLNRLISFFNYRISNLPQDVQPIFKALLLGDKQDVSKDVLNDFSESNISHVLAISGMHISYIILISNLVFNFVFGKHYSKIATSIILIIYIYITGFTPSVVRAGIAGILAIMSNFVYRKSDTFSNLAFAMLVILICNPYSIKSISLQLSFVGAIGIIVISKTFKKVINFYFEKLKKKAKKKNDVFLLNFLNFRSLKLILFLEDNFIITISACIVIMPILLVTFHTINITNLLIGIITSVIIGPIVILGILYLIIGNSSIGFVLTRLLNLLLGISKVGALLPLNKIYFVTPNMFEIIIYYVLIFSVNFIISIKLNRSLNSLEKRVVNLLNLAKYIIVLNKKKILFYSFIIFFLCLIFMNIPKSLKIYFIDVGQGDSSLIITPRNKKILIDGGGSSDKDFDVGKQTVLPYLLNRNINKLDYVIISHFDQDHVRSEYYIF